MSALTEAIAAPEVKRCPVGKAIDSLIAADPASAADCEAWMRGVNGLTDKAMHKGMQALGYRVSIQSLGRHRRDAGECACSQ